MPLTQEEVESVPPHNKEYIRGKKELSRVLQDILVAHKHTHDSDSELELLEHQPSHQAESRNSDNSEDHPVHPAPTTTPSRPTIQQAYEHITQRIKQQDTEHLTLRAQQQTDLIREWADKNQKQGNKLALGLLKEGDTRLRALRTAPDTLPTSDPNTVLQHLSDYWGGLAQPPMGRAKTGIYDQPQELPFQKDNAPDRMTHVATTVPEDRPALLQAIADESTFKEIISNLSNGKTPGPDKIPNEIFKYLPAPYQAMIHKFLILLWKAGKTPLCWKHSETALLYKKEDPYDVKNYRPIGLLNTVYKLWTATIAYSIYNYAEKYNILSKANAGFRQLTATTDKITLIQMMLEDARLFQNDIFLLLVDFSNAFNTVDHDKLLVILYHLGIPKDAIEVVKDLYTDVTTSIKTVYGPTEPIKVDRGSIQGDSLSPLIFILYLEPLLRWLQNGGKGYKFSCLSREDRETHRVSNPTFADDLTVATSSAMDLQAQGEKISLCRLGST